jgi:SAM-dependent methyltransferase
MRLDELSSDDLACFCLDIFPHHGPHDLFVSEAQFGLSRLLPVLSSFDHAPELIEVGAGHCILSAYLASKGLSVTAAEPLGPEFDYFSGLQATVVEFCMARGYPLRVIRATAERLQAPDQFDVAFTINALEHMPDPLKAIDNMYVSLKPGGMLLAHCPNYTVPFEPHFNILLVTRSKRINEWLFRSIVSRRPEIWNGLSFIRYRDLRRHLVRRGFPFRFNHSVMADLVARTLSDRAFAQRMPTAVRSFSKFLKVIGLIKGLTLIPARVQTPMEVLIRKKPHHPLPHSLSVTNRGTNDT